MELKIVQYLNKICSSCLETLEKNKIVDDKIILDSLFKPATLEEIEDNQVIITTELKWNIDAILEKRAEIESILSNSFSKPIKIKVLEVEEINEIEIKDIAYNSRNCEDGFMFVASVGETVDGHKFVRNAYDNGARIFLLQSGMESDKNVMGLPEDAVKIFVDDTRIRLSRVSHNFFNKPSESLKIVGVTGTKGKTTITNYIATVLNEAGINTGVIGTNGTFFNGTYEVTANTTPESYELHRIFRKMLDNGVKCVSMEVE